ncbi:MAG TPA: DNA primase [Candidatus Paceibacterota bacterium]|jgi:DNA primase|nr:DNA primase [Candidatus Paceibacterota bacterium]
MNSPVDKIKERLSIEEVVSSYIKLEKSGINWKAKCPFHNEKTPSFFVSSGRGSYYCFGCNASGDIFTFVEEFEGLDFKGALKLLADKAGVALEKFDPANKENQSEKERLYEAMEEAAKFFENNLKASAEVLGYLKTRGLEEKSIKDFRVGYIKPDWRELYSHLQKKGFTDAEMERAGLVKKTDKGFYDRFRGRVMFPIGDSSGRIIAFSGRLFQDDEKSAKYLNSPDTPIFSKYLVFFGLDKAKESIRKNNFSILVEGQMDLILSHQAGFRNTVATSGTALSDATVSRENVVSNLGLVRRLSDNIVLAFDSDKAGFGATLRAGKIALSLGMDVKVAKMEAELDPADLISKSGADAWKEAIRGSTHLIEFLLVKVLADAKGDSRKAGREIKDTILPFVSSIDSSIEQMHFIKKISDMSSISEQALKDDLKKIPAQASGILEVGGEKALKGEVRKFRKDYIERKLLGIIIWQKTLSDSSINIEEITKNVADILKITPQALIEKSAPDKEDLIFEAEVFYGGEMNLKKDVDELILNLEEEYLNEERIKKMQELHIYEEKKDISKGREILKEINEINNKIQNIKNSRIKK